MPKTNDEILSEYQSEFYERMGPIVLAVAEGKPVEDRSEAETIADAKFMIEAFHMVDSFLADPAKPLLQAKLAFDSDDHKNKWNHAELVEKMAEMTTFFAKWKPGALFV